MTAHAHTESELKPPDKPPVVATATDEYDPLRPVVAATYAEPLRRLAQLIANTKRYEDEPMTEADADGLVFDLTRVPSVVGWPYTKAEMLRPYFVLVKAGLDMAAQRMESRALRDAAGRIDVERFVAVWAREERA